MPRLARYELKPINVTQFRRFKKIIASFCSQCHSLYRALFHGLGTEKMLPAAQGWLSLRHKTHSHDQSLKVSVGSGSLPTGWNVQETERCSRMRTKEWNAENSQLVLQREFSTSLNSADGAFAGIWLHCTQPCQLKLYHCS